MDPRECADNVPSYITKKRTIIKPRVGCVRTTTYDLPNDAFTYGKANEVMDEGAGDIISNWITANPSAAKQSQKMVVAQNILAVKKGCITAKSMRQYGLDHPNVRMKEVLIADNGNSTGGANHEGPFGKKTVFADEGIGSLIQARYTNFENEDVDYPSITTIKKTGSLPKPKPTRASLSVAEAREKAEESKQQKRFCMKRFQNVQRKQPLY